MRFWSRPLLASFAVLFSISLAHGEVVYDEATMGDLSADNTLPTPVFFQFQPGTNTVVGEISDGTADIFTFEIAEGYQLSSLVLSGYDQPDDRMFVAMSAGDQFPSSFDEVNDPFFPDTSEWLGSLLIGDADLNNDVLALIGGPQNLGGTGFTPPLGSGEYSFYIQQTGDVTSYSLDFNVTAVPEPSTTFACGLALIVVIGYRRFRRAPQGSAVHTAV
jgi:hypothetical protein